MPRANRRYWENKVAGNLKRDRRAKRDLAAMGWHYATVWECSLEMGIRRAIGKIGALKRSIQSGYRA